MLKITKLSDATNKEWDYAWDGCNYATFFHSREWFDIWSKYTNGNISPCPKIVLFSDGAKAVLCLSSRKINRGLSFEYVSSPASTYGGWVSSDPLNREHTLLLTNKMTSLGNLAWRINPFSDFTLKTMRQGVKNDFTHAIELDLGFDSVAKMWSKGHRAAPRQAEKLGLTVRLARSLDDWKAYYKVYLDSIRRWGDTTTSCYSFKIFEIMFRTNLSGIKLWLADCSETVVAGAICLYSKSHVVYWHGAALESHFQMRPTNLLMRDAIKDACECGYKWFDFNPSGGHEGVAAFKRSFGTKEFSCPVVSTKTFITNKICAVKTFLEFFSK